MKAALRAVIDGILWDDNNWQLKLSRAILDAEIIGYFTLLQMRATSCVSQRPIPRRRTR